MAESTEIRDENCPRCQTPVSLAAELCPYCRSRLTVDVRVLTTLADGRARYQLAREVIALGAPAPDLRQVQQALSSEGVLVRGATRLFAERVTELLARYGVDAAVQPWQANPAAAVGRLLGRAVPKQGRHHLFALVSEHPLLALGLFVLVAGAVALFVSMRELPDLTPAEIGKRSLPATALLRCKDSLGSGFFVSKDLLITNAHVVCPGIQVQVGKKSYPAQVVKQDDGVDLALLKVPDAGAHRLPLGDATTLHVGDPVVLLGSPQGLGDSLQQGTVSNVGRGVMGNAYVQIDANVNPGNSGGPLIDRKGRVVGVITMAYTGGKGIGFALPINYATQSLGFVRGPSQRDWRGLSRPGVLLFQEWTAQAEQDDAKEADEIRTSIDRPTLVAAVPGPDHATIAVLVQRSGWMPSAVVRPFRVSRNGMRVCEGKLRVARWIHPEADGGPEPAYLRWLRKHGLDEGLYIGVAPVGSGRECSFEAVVGGDMVMVGEDGRDDHVSIVPATE